MKMTAIESHNIIKAFYLYYKMLQDIKYMSYRYAT